MHLKPCLFLFLYIFSFSFLNIMFDYEFNVTGNPACTPFSRLHGDRTLRVQFASPVHCGPSESPPAVIKEGCSWVILPKEKHFQFIIICLWPFFTPPPVTIPRVVIAAECFFLLLLLSKVGLFSGEEKEERGETEIER